MKYLTTEITVDQHIQMGDEPTCECHYCGDTCQHEICDQCLEEQKAEDRYDRMKND